MKDEIFLLDSNILVYAFDSSEKAKHRVAKELLKLCWLGSTTYAVSIQNLSEFFVNVTKKVDNPISKQEGADIVKKMIEFEGLVKIEPTKETVAKALDIILKSNTSYWDALIAATMVENRIFKVYTENTKDFSKIEAVKAENPFA